MSIRLSRLEFRKLAEAAPDGAWSRNPADMDRSDRTNEPATRRDRSRRHLEVALEQRVAELEGLLEGISRRLEEADAWAAESARQVSAIEQRLELLTERAQRAVNELARRIGRLAGK